MRGSAGSISGDATRSAVLALLARGPLSRADIVSRLGLGAATVTAVVRRLLAEGFVTEQPARASEGGRPAVPVALVADAGVALGVHLSADRLTAVVLTLDGKPVVREQRPFDPSSPRALAGVLRTVTALAARAKGPARRLIAVGVTVPGVVDPSTGTFVMSVRLGWSGSELVTRLREAVDVPVFVDNDVIALTAAERSYGRGVDCTDFLLLALGQGVGMGLVLDGAPYRGAHGAGGEFGHVPITKRGLPCSCGNSGCLETILSTGALLARARALGLSAPRLEDLDRLAGGGDRTALRLLRTAGEVLGRAMAGAVNLLGPQRLLVTGETTALWPHLEPGFRHALEPALLPVLRGLEIEIRPWDSFSLAAGAAGMVLAAPLSAPPQSAWGRNST